MSLFCANFFQALFGYTLPMYTLLAQTSRFLSTPNHCIFIGYSMVSFTLISIFMITIMIGHRFYLIKKPFQGRMIKSRRSIALLLSSTAWVLGFISALPPALSEKIAFQHYQQRHYCSLDWNNSSIENSLYITFLIVMAYLVPISFYCFTYLNGTRDLRTSIASNRVHQSMKRYHVTVILMLVFFLVSWTPYGLAGFMTLAKYKVNIKQELICSMFAKMSSIWNSLLYFIMHITSFKCINSPHLVRGLPLPIHRRRHTATQFTATHFTDLNLLLEDPDHLDQGGPSSRIDETQKYAISLAQEIIESVMTNQMVQTHESAPKPT